MALSLLVIAGYLRLSGCPSERRDNSPTAACQLPPPPPPRRFYDILGGIASPYVRTPWAVFWWRVFRAVKVDVSRNRISAGENIQKFKLLDSKPFSQHQTFLEFELTARK